MFHTQENRRVILSEALKCVRDDAWLGEGYYFWYDDQDAFQWGHLTKCRTGRFDIYEAGIECENVLDTVFNEEHYKFWLRQIEKAAKTIVRRTSQKPTLKQINQYFRERASWNEVDGIMFQDIPENDTILTVQKFYYKKRIQLGAFTKKIISDFKLIDTYPCLRS